ncbi:predicted protein [Plenodomus lingam JN3]|uniref:Predicted protein n=1 Tax=Leptosphaeria maculans (strain JN3 / isolate v23.1.3 / race Av1-4-5-6-7-8) TaxID=985895 RepID=E5A1F4_LEPMJ|nr:predicted protein [Plenodomus lingam JN3]CBX97418.1 predicted protein [Plenodomus lingam JN3]
MKYALALSALVASSYAGAIPGDVQTGIQRRAANPQPVCTFEEHSFYDKNWGGDGNTLANLKRDLGKKTWDPPANLVKPLEEVWKHQMDTYGNQGMNFKNFGYDQVMAAKGKINYCVRWEGNQKVSLSQRGEIETAIRRQFKKWIDVLADFEGFPYKTVDVKVVGWAVNDKNQLEGDVSKIQVYTTKDENGIPECAPGCGRFHHQDGDYSGCKAGADRHYDQSLWLTPGFGGGAGGDWGQRVSTEYFMDNIKQEDIHIVLHEIGHTFALDDFYDWTPTGVDKFLMKAGSAMKITEFDAWMARDWWMNLKRERGW